MTFKNTTLVSPLIHEGKDEAKYELVGFDSLPEYLKDNEFILGSYRSEWPWKQTIVSLFSIHNETLNKWTYVRTNQTSHELYFIFPLFSSLTLCETLLLSGI